MVDPLASRLEIRRYGSDDESAVLDLMRLSLGRPPDARSRDLFRWKHHDSAFGRSPAWVAVADGDIVGYRTFMRWTFERGGDLVSAVRAVDTVTHPDHRGRGIFRMLTLRALEELRDAGVGFVFNTPNDQSRPGYLKMGWQPVGTLPVAMTPRSLLSVPRIARARVPASLWSQPSPVGRPAEEVLAHAGLPGLLGSLPAPRGLRTQRTVEALRWRYGSGPVTYRAVTVGADVSEGVVVFRLRRRGAAVEAAVADLLLPRGQSSHGLVRRVLTQTGADYAVALRPRPAGTLVLRHQGPLLLWRAVCESSPPPLADWQLALGDVELF